MSWLGGLWGAVAPPSATTPSPEPSTPSPEPCPESPEVSTESPEASIVETAVLYNELQLHIQPDKIYVTANGASHAICIDTATAEIVAEPTPTDLTDGREIHGIVGIISLPLTHYLILISERTEVGSIDGHNTVYKMSKYELIPFRESHSAAEATKQLNEKYLHLVHKALHAPSYYFSYTSDLSHTLQRNTDKGLNSLTYMERADERFVWNEYLLAQIGSCPELAGFTLPLVYGVLSITTCSLEDKTFDFVIFSRRSRHRTGVRYFVRGGDSEGNVANFLETEQVVRYDGQIASHVSTRGSVPLYWSQRSNITCTPRVKLHNEAGQKQVFVKHMQQQIALYGQHVMVSLLETQGKEKELCEALTYIATQNPLPGVTYVHFDFHKHCRKMRGDNLTFPMEQIEEECEQFGYYFRESSGVVSSTQRGVVRTNCIDCLERTNTVQSVLARRVLSKQLQQMGVLAEGQEIGTSHLEGGEETGTSSSQFEEVYRKMWADNGDGVALQYTGTPALNTDYTRTGVRTRTALLHDAYTALQRYVHNNFLDGSKQDSYDLLVGNYRYKAQEQSPLTQQRHPVAILLPALIALFFALFVLKLVVPKETWFSQASHLGVYTGLLALLVKKALAWGNYIVDQPKLYQTLAKAKAD